VNFRGTHRAAPPATAEGVSPFRLRPFRIYWAGGVLSNTGTWLYNVSASVVMFEMTGSSFMVGLLNFATFAPVFAFSFFAGVLSDRIERRRLVIVASSGSLVASMLLTAVAASGRLTVGILITVSFILGTSYAFAKPSISALLPAFIENSRLAHATAINTMQFTFGQVLGSLLSAVVLATVGATWAFGLNAVTYLGPITAMTLLRPYVRQTRETKASGWSALQQGLRFIVKDSGLLPVVLAVVCTNGIVETVRTLSPALADEALGLSADKAGLLVGAIAGGSILGTASFGRASRRLRPSVLARIGFALQMVGALGVSTGSLHAATFAAVIIGVGFAYLIPQLSATMLVASPDAYRGRVMAAFSMAHLGLRPIWSVLAGWLATVLDAPLAVALLIGSAIAGVAVLRGGAVLDRLAVTPDDSPT
jgi:Na+/melibiose symporter-like transporter